uniref:ATP synthase subunit a n=1 Tax=Mesostigma viride TaxID=41882 RepID=Q8W9T3_MESVI|nr:ATP synthase F0 subunit 6 [Mesostigma viride]AAL36725.1 ATP synthase F0 subunit 6 [Mesostigma viride]ADU04586.1 ATP synthase F0 subunit 6 [Mesostigma viride]
MEYSVFSPLEQFAIFYVIPISIGTWNISITNSALFLFTALALGSLWFSFATQKGGQLIGNAWQTIVEMIYEFVFQLLFNQIARKGLIYFPLIFTLFTFLILCNLLGMIPYSFTVTSHLIVTLSLSFSLFIGVTIVGFQNHGLHFFSFLLPPGAPLALAPLLVTLELISYCFRALSLGIRLFANMMAGHTLVKILSGFAWSMLSMGGFFLIAQLAPLGIVVAITGLELGVALLQAYVFTILICIYLNDSINLH